MPAPTRPQMTAGLTKEPHSAWMFPVGGFIHGVIDTDHVFWELNTSPNGARFGGTQMHGAGRQAGFGPGRPPLLRSPGPGSRPRAASKLFTAPSTAGLPVHTDAAAPNGTRAVS